MIMRQVVRSAGRVVNNIIIAVLGGSVQFLLLYRNFLLLHSLGEERSPRYNLREIKSPTVNQNEGVFILNLKKLYNMLCSVFDCLHVPERYMTKIIISLYNCRTAIFYNRSLWFSVCLMRTLKINKNIVHEIAIELRVK